MAGEKYVEIEGQVFSVGEKLSKERNKKKRIPRFVAATIFLATMACGAEETTPGLPAVLPDATSVPLPTATPESISAPTEAMPSPTEINIPFGGFVCFGRNGVGTMVWGMRRENILGKADPNGPWRTITATEFDLQRNPVNIQELSFTPLGLATGKDTLNINGVTATLNQDSETLTIVMPSDGWELLNCVSASPNP
jgi:hypothetical protein